MKKVLGAALIAALVGTSAASAMDYRIGVQMKTDGGWSPLTYRYSDYSDDKAQTAHVLESNGEAVTWINGNYVVPVGDPQVLGESIYSAAAKDAVSYAGTYQDGVAFWGGGIKAFRFQPIFQGASNTGEWKFGARFMIKNKEHEAFAGNGWSTWLDYKHFEIKAATTGLMGYGAYVGTGGNFLTATSALFNWLLVDNTAPYYKQIKQQGTDAKNRNTFKGNIDDFNYFGYQVSNVGLGVENVSDKATGVGIKWVQQVRDGKDTLDIRLVNMHSTKQSGQGYDASRDYDATYPVGWHVQANYRMPHWTFCGTFKMRGSNSDTSGKYERPEAFNIAGHFGLSTNLIPGVSFSTGYAFIGEDVGNGKKTEIDGVNYSHEFWGHNFGVNVGWKIRDWSFDAGNTTTLMLLSDYMKARSSANLYAWRPYLGTSLTVNAHKRINGLMNSHISVGFTDANMNSYTDGKAEAEIWIHPNVDISPARGVNLNVALHASLSNFSNGACGWWSDYNSDQNYGNGHGEVYYTYPHTLTISIPISLSFFI